MTEAERDTTHQAALDEIVALATDLARRIHAAATGATPEITLEQASKALDRTARIVRRTVLLSQRLPTLKARHPDRTQVRRQVIRGVEHAIHTVARHDPDRHDALRAELQERLDREDFEHDTLTRPIPDLIVELAQDLGVAFQGQSFTHPRRTPKDIDRLIQRAMRRAHPPFAHLMAEQPDDPSFPAGSSSFPAESPSFPAHPPDPLPG